MLQLQQLLLVFPLLQMLMIFLMLLLLIFLPLQMLLMIFLMLLLGHPRGPPCQFYLPSAGGRGVSWSDTNTCTRIMSSVLRGPGQMISAPKSGDGGEKPKQARNCRRSSSLGPNYCG